MPTFADLHDFTQLGACVLPAYSDFCLILMIMISPPRMAITFEHGMNVGACCHLEPHPRIEGHAGPFMKMREPLALNSPHLPGEILS